METSLFIGEVFLYTTSMATPRAKLIKKLDDAFSKYIRLRYAADGLASCVTCGVMKPWKELQCGHYESRGAYGTRWDERNCHVQCYSCNVMRKGNYPAYSRYLVRRFGPSILDELELRSNSSPKFKMSELQLMLDDYTTRVVALTKTNGGATIVPLG